MTNMTPLELIFFTVGFFTVAILCAFIVIGALGYGVHITTKFVKALFAFSNKYKVKKPSIKEETPYERFEWNRRFNDQ